MEIGESVGYKSAIGIYKSESKQQYISTRTDGETRQLEVSTQSILAKGFRSELTEQWRKEYPELISGKNSAKTLLDRIQTKRVLAKPIGRGKRKAG